MGKKTMTLNLTEAEMKVLELFSVQKQMSKTLVMRQALRLYQKIDVHIESGGKLTFENDTTGMKTEIIMI